MFKIVFMALAIAILELGSTSKAESPVRNSVKGEILEVIIGSPDAIASSSTSPHPSFIEGKTKASAQRYKIGIITVYEFSVSSNNRRWKTVAKGEFGNIVNSPIEQTVNFDGTKGRYIKLKGVKVDGEDLRASFAEVGVITE